MSILNITGGRPLQGKLRIHGAKNSVLPILAATLLCKGTCVIHNCPDLMDVHSSLRILQHLGCKATFANSTVTIDATDVTMVTIPEKLMREMRSSVIFLGAILARMGEACMSYPGGCELGSRPIDLHLSALRQLGTEIQEENGNLLCKAHNLQGKEIILSFPSVGATENIMVAACACQGTTCIKNAAREPEIEDLQNFLCAMGAKVSGAGSSTIYIEGGQSLHGASHNVIPDRIVTATYLAAVAAVGGQVRLESVVPEHISSILSILEEAGCEVTQESDAITLARYKPLLAVKPVRTMPYPGFPTDAQSPLMAMCAVAKGTTVFIENIFENRFRHVAELTRMGSDIRVEGRVAVVTGVEKLYGAPVSSTDLRGGAALVVAALAAEGTSAISELQHIDRGYENLELNLQSLGADIKRT